MFQAPVSVKDVLDKIERRIYLLPAIQREFVWSPDQITTLFDSILRSYPIGPLLFWEVEPKRKRDFEFYEFLREFHERDQSHNPKAIVAPDDREIIAVLDGQQRLTALNIGFRGTHTTRQKYARRKTEASYVKGRLYLNLTRKSSTPGRLFDLEFRKDDDDYVTDSDGVWFRVGAVYKFKKIDDTFAAAAATFNNTPHLSWSMKCLPALWHALNDPTINFFLEKEQDLDRVLDIFIRVNSGGTKLSYSDLLMSIATAQWDKTDAREAIHGLVDEINRDLGDFDFERDFVLKCALMLAELDLRWAVENFKKTNMQLIEAMWPEISGAIRLAVRLLSSLGFTKHHLPSTVAVVPIVYYLSKRKADVAYVDGTAFREDRAAVRRWLCFALLARIFSGNSDQVLKQIRDVIRESPGAFPAEAIRLRLAGTSRPLAFSQEQVEGLLDAEYGSSYAFPTLALLYPDLDFRNRFHLDHIHPKSHFTDSQLEKRGVPEDERGFFRDNFNRLVNIQMLEGLPNVEKKDRPFQEWLNETHPPGEQLERYRERNYIPSTDHEFTAFRAFADQRRLLMLQRLGAVLGVAVSVDHVDSDDDGPSRGRADFHGDCIAVLNNELGLSLVAAEGDTSPDHA